MQLLLLQKALLLSWFPFHLVATAPPPHIIMVLVDDLGYHNVPFHNPEQIAPNIQTLAANGVILEGHYVFQYCSPTRSSFLSGRLPIHVNTQQPDPGQTPGGIDLRMTLLPQWLKTVNYSTHMVGKGHLGAYVPANLPINRGFDSHLGFLGGGEDHYTQRAGDFVDLWRDHGPAYGENGTYSCDLYGAEALKILTAHDAATPFFMYLAFHNTHAPYEVPAKWLDPTCTQPLRQLLQGMLTCTDSVLGELVTLLKSKGMYDNTLLVWSSDNGGPQYWGANNYPLRGGKGSDFEGGVRAAAFVSGGLLPPAVRGTVLREPIHICDWYTTFARLAGVANPTPNDPGVPPIDSLDMWPLLSGQALVSPRMEIPLSDWSLIVGNFKVVNRTFFLNNWDADCNGNATGSANCRLGQWTGALWPQVNCGGGGTPEVCPHVCNATVGCTVDPGCPLGACLFDLSVDPLETTDISTSNPQHLQDMLARLAVIGLTKFQTTTSGMVFSQCAPSWADNLQRHGNFAAPLCNASAPAPLLPSPPLLTL